MKSRTKNTKRNIIASYLLMIVQMLFQFVSRSAIVHALGAEYLGLSSLFTSILSVLSIAESGFSASVIYFMYKPLADGDTVKICALLNYLKKVYFVVGCVILGVGLIITPLCSFLIKGDTPADINIYYLYIMYLVNLSIGYFLYAYKTSLLTAVQRLDLTKIANAIVIIVQYSLQLVALLVFKNYYLFVFVMIVGTAFTSLFTSYVCDKKFPDYKCIGELDLETKKDIKVKVIGLLICNISSVTYTSLDSIVISSFIGLTTVAIYNNYITIYSTISSFIAMIRTSMQASVGNSIVSESLEKNYSDVKLWQFLFSIIATWCMTCMICLYQPFMELWMGSNMLLPMIDVILIGVWFLIGSVQHAFYLYLSGAGLWNKMKWAYIFSACLNLILNVILGKMLGVSGIILASLIATIFSGMIWQCSVIFKHYFCRSSIPYIATQLFYFMIAAIIALITYFTCELINSNTLSGFFLKALLCITICTVLLWIAYVKSSYYRQAKKLLYKAIKR